MDISGKEEKVGFTEELADLDYPHMICDQILARWVDVKDYPADATSVTFADQSDFKCVFELYWMNEFNFSVKITS